MDIFTVLIWLLATLVIGSFSGVIGKRYGVEYPIAIMACLIPIANILANKIVVFGPFTVPAGTIVFSMTFLITDILSEVWGKKYAQKAVWAGFYAALILVISLWIANAWPAAPFAQESAQKFKEVLGLTPRICLATLVVYLVAQHHDVWAFHFWREKTGGKHLWLRNNASTIVSQLIDSVVFCFIAFYGVFPIGPMIGGLWIVKIIIALIDTPFMYGVLWLMSKVESREQAAVA